MHPSNFLQFKKLFESQVQKNVSSPVEGVAYSDGPCDDADLVTFLQERSVSDTLQNRKVISIQSATAALERIRLGSFGICQECDEEIGLNRLKVLPTASFCIQCQEVFEYRNSVQTAI